MLEIDHGWVHSIYTNDPDGISVEFAVITQPLTHADKAEAEALLFAESPSLDAATPWAWLHMPGVDEPTVLMEGTVKEGSV